MRATLLMLAMVVGPAPGAQTQHASALPPDITGNWAGTLSTAGGPLRLIAHFTHSASGGLAGTLDSLDQGAIGIPIARIGVEGASLKFAVDTVNGSYRGNLNAAGDTIQGVWSQGQPVPLELRRVQLSDLDGAWAGTLESGDTTRRLVLHIATGPEGLIASLQLPDQGNAVLPASHVTRNALEFRFEVDQGQARFAGKLDAGRTAITGTLTQGSLATVVELTRVRDAAELRPPRPQNPSKPYPYREEEVVYENPRANIRLAGTLTIPQGDGPFPAALLITGSGPQDRDETIAAHKPFLVLADFLTRRGIAILRADDRGVGKSTGRFAGATTADFSTDAEAGVAWLRTRPEIDHRKIGLIGHSEGGTIAPMVAARNRDVAFIVMLAGTGVPGDDIIVEQSRLIALADGATREEADRLAAQQRKITNLVKSEPSPDVLKPKLRELLAGKPASQIEPLIGELVSPWYRYFLTYDPATMLRRVTCPVLALNGDKDVQVPPALNLTAIRKALDAGGNKDFEVIEMPGLNHMFQHAGTGSPSEYGQIDETIAPAVLEKVAIWIARL